MIVEKINETLEAEEKLQAIWKHLLLDEDQIEEIEVNGDHYTFNDEEYLVVTDDEADQLWEEHLDNYIEECILDEMPDHLRSYFDEDKWKQDAKIDGRGHSLATYDGCEDWVKINNTDYYIYRTN